jgi:hypothetical protein
VHRSTRRPRPARHSYGVHEDRVSSTMTHGASAQIGVAVPAYRCVRIVSVRRWDCLFAGDARADIWL